MFAAEAPPGEEVVRASAERLKGSLVHGIDLINWEDRWLWEEETFLRGLLRPPAMLGRRAPRPLLPLGCGGGGGGGKFGGMSDTDNDDCIGRALDPLCLGGPEDEE